MTSRARTASLALIVGGALGLFGVPDVAGQATAERLTTDTAEYCAHLVDRLRQVEHDRGHAASPEVVALSDEGQLMCDHGETRRGILRLRRAMRLMLGAAPR